MRDAALVARAEADIVDLAAFVRDLVHVRSDFHLWGSEGFPGTGDSPTSGGDHSDAVAALALRHVAARREGRPDAMREYHEIERDLTAIHDATVRLAHRLQVAQTTKATTPGAEGCMNCERAGLFVAPYEKSRKRRLCRNCYEFRSEFDVVPVADICLLWNAGRKVTGLAIVEYHPELAEAVKHRARRLAIR